MEKVNKQCIVQITSGRKRECVGEIKIFASLYHEKLCIINLTRLERQVHEVLVGGGFNKNLVESLQLINTRKCAFNDNEEGRIYFDIPNLGIYIKRNL